MNKIFTADNYRSFIKPERIENVLKFYQSTVNIPELYNKWNEDEKSKINIKAYDNYFDLPESYLDSFTMSNLSANELHIFSKINDFFKSEKPTYILPIFVINKSKNIPPGIYSIDFIKKILFKYKEFDKQTFGATIHEDFDICICYFVDLYESVFYYGELGFTNGIFQIGKLFETVECEAKKYKICTYSEYVPQQIFSRNLGINCRVQIFIKNQYLKGI